MASDLNKSLESILLEKLKDDISWKTPSALR